jgi:hypothetical protein
VDIVDVRPSGPYVPGPVFRGDLTASMTAVIMSSTSGNANRKREGSPSRRFWHLRLARGAPNEGVQIWVICALMQKGQQLGQYCGVGRGRRKW